MLLPWLLGITFVPFVLAIVRLIRLYTITGGIDYVYFALLFLFGGIGGVLISVLPLDPLLFKGLSVTNTLIAYLLWIRIISASTRDIQIPLIHRLLHIGLVFYVFLATSFIWLEYQYPSLVILDDFRIIHQEIIRFSIGLYAIWSFRKFNLYIDQRKTRLIRRLWVLTGYVYLLSGLLIGLSYVTYMGLVEFTSYTRTELNFLIELAMLARLLIFFVPQSIIILYVAIFIPEYLLISHFQLYTASKLYDILETHQDDVTYEDPKIENERLLAYLTEVAAKVKSLNQ